MSKVLVIDFGSQYCNLIARRVREQGIYSEILPANKANIVEIAKSYDALIFSGGPSSVYDDNALLIDKEIFNIGKPILGTCYGMQLIHHLLGGKVEKLSTGEYGKVNIKIVLENDFINYICDDSVVWMSHFDSVVELAPGFEVIATTDLCNAITANKAKKIYTTQFHPEVEHTTCGHQMLHNFLFEIAHLRKSWYADGIAKNKIKMIKEKVGNEKVILGLSGGVDSTVLAALLHEAIGDNLIPIFIDNGLLRKDEVEQVINTFKNELKIDLHVVDAKKEFYSALKGITDPEQKRKAIGKVFIEEFTKAKKKFSNAKFLAQGTIYPDIIESAGVNGVAKVIKSHHNVGGLPDEVDFEIIEPLKDLFKDEVRVIGRTLGLCESIISRHPFPGPGLAIRIIGEVNEEMVRICQNVDEILIRILRKYGIYENVSQAAAILTPLKTVGVQGDERTYAYLAAIRIVNTNDFMTATFSRIDFNILEKISTTIINEVKEVNRVVYDITSKPPATIEWE